MRHALPTTILLPALGALIALAALPGTALAGSDPPEADETAAPPGLDRGAVDVLIYRLLDSPLPPEEHDSAVAKLSDPTASVSAGQVARLLKREAPWGAHLAGAQIAAARNDPAMVPNLLRAYLAARGAGMEYDPDIFERARRGLQSLPVEAVRTGLEGDLSFVAEMAEVRLRQDWLQMNGWPEDRPLDRPVSKLAEPAISELTRQMVGEVLVNHPWGLTALQTGFGDWDIELLTRCDVILLVSLLAAGSDDDYDAARRVILDREFAQGDLEAACRILDRVEPDSQASSNGSVRAVMGELEPGATIERSPPRSRTSPSLAPPRVEPFEASPMWTPVEVPSRWVRVVVALVVLGVLWFGLVRFVPSARPWMFRAAALSLAPLLILAIELGLLVAGVEPLASRRPMLDPTSASGELTASSMIRDTAYIVSSSSGTRYFVLEENKPAGAVRVFTHGGSSVHGSDYLVEESWSAVLGRRLQTLFPDVEIQTVNCGFGGSCSDQVVMHVQETMRLGADLLVLSLGYNDFAWLPRLQRSGRWPTVRILGSGLVTRSRIAGLLSLVLPILEWEPEEAVVESGIDPDEKDIAKMQRLVGWHMEHNLALAHRLDEEQGVEVIFVLQGQNEEECGTGGAEGVTASKLDCFPVQAREAVARVARGRGMTVVDPIPAMRENAPDGRIGYAHYWDTIHATPLGHAIIGEAAAPAAAEAIQRRLERRGE